MFNKMRIKMKNPFIIIIFLLVAFSTLIGSTESKGGGGGGRGGGGVGGGRSSGSGKSGGKRGALIAGAVGGVAGYAAYRAHHTAKGHRFHTDPLENPAFSSQGGPSGPDWDGDPDYKLQESTYYSRRPGLGMSAFGLLALILGIIGGGTLIWYCYVIGVPLWNDRQRRNQNSNEGHPLQETPSTATPSP